MNEKLESILEKAIPITAAVAIAVVPLTKAHSIEQEAQSLIATQQATHYVEPAETQQTPPLIATKPKTYSAEPKTQPEQEPEPLTHYIKLGFGVLGPVPAEKTIYDPSLFFSAGYGLIIPNVGPGELGFEFSLDYFRSFTEYTNPVLASIETDSFFPRISAIYTPFDESNIIKPIGIFSINALAEFSNIKVPRYNVDVNESNIMAGLEPGLGLTIDDRFDARITYSWSPWSKNAKGILVFTGAYRLIFPKEEKK